MSTWINEGGPDREISSKETETCLKQVVDALPAGLKRVLIIPPDFSRFHSGAGAICSQLYFLLAKRAAVELLPALGTHRPMTAAEITQMFPGVPHDLIRIHYWQ